MSHNISDAERVKEFSEGSKGKPCPETPNEMTKNEVGFVIGMVLSELVEMAQTVCESDEEAVEFVKSRVATDLKHYNTPSSMEELIADQADAAVDAIYYLYNCFAMKGVNLSKIFDIVHQANLAKRDPATGQYIRRESDGKVIKPPGWKAPDIRSEIVRQMCDGSWEKKL